MAVTDGYSRVVLWLKVSLPLAALAILSTLFFVAETLDPEAAIPFATVDVERILTEQGVNKPRFGTVTSAGVAIALTADVIRPSDNPTRMDAEQLVAVLDLPDGARLDIKSDAGFLNTKTREATLQGGVRLESSTGYVIATERIRTSIEEARVIADSEIHATGPGGEIRAGEMELTRSKTDNSYLLVFKSGVRLLYKP